MGLNISTRNLRKIKTVSLSLVLWLFSVGTGALAVFFDPAYVQSTSNIRPIQASMMLVVGLIIYAISYLSAMLVISCTEGIKKL